VVFFPFLSTGPENAPVDDPIDYDDYRSVGIQAFETATVPGGARET